MSEDNIPRAKYSGTFMLGNVEMRCHVLEDGTAIIEAECIEKLFEDGAIFEANDVNEFMMQLKTMGNA